MGTALAITLALLQNSEPRTSATTCDAIYYGIGRPPDLAKAYECYASDGDFEMQIVMILNGDGMPQDPRRVEALFVEWSKHDNWQATSSAQAKALREALASLRAGRLNKHLDFCESIAGDTLAGSTRLRPRISRPLRSTGKRCSSKISRSS